jgi:hypothetical protein
MLFVGSLICLAAFALFGSQLPVAFAWTLIGLAILGCLAAALLATHWFIQLRRHDERWTYRLAATLIGVIALTLFTLATTYAAYFLFFYEPR